MKLAVICLLAACGSRSQPVVSNGTTEAPADARLVFARQVYAALADGDAQALVKLADQPKAAFECPEAATEPTGMQRAAFERAAALDKGFAIDVVGLAGAPGPDPNERHVAKGEPDGLCTANADVQYHTIWTTVRVRRGDGPTVEQRVGIGAVALDGRWYLLDVPQLSYGVTSR